MAIILETTTEEMEIGETRSDCPETAQRAGERIVRKYRAQGHACECLGVVAGTEPLAIERETDHKIKTAEGLTMREERTSYVDRTFYRPVIFPKAATDEE